MSHADLDINRGIRTVLVKHWIDLGRLSVRSSDGKVWIRGALLRIAGVNEELSAPIVDAMFAEIKRIKNVRQVYPALENWNNDSGSWVPAGDKKSEQQTVQRATTVYDITKGSGDK
ncbi:MAG: hypothetical protein PHR77_00865 [Kiritimatiellae bacterium]|nr:hypothetical protein [Kiritimatiellia bacterium]